MVKVNFTPEQAMKAQRGSRGQLYFFFFNLSAILEWVVNASLRLVYLREGNPVAIVQEAEWAQGRSGRVRKISPSPVFDPFRA